MSVSERKFGALPTGEEVKIYHLENKKGAYAEVLQYGAILVKVCVPDKDGRLTDVVLGYYDLQCFFVYGCFFGGCIGRSVNRIADSRFMLDGTEIKLTPNEGKNNLHSGPDGFEKKLWNASAVDGQNAVTFSRISPDGENGYPGEFEVSVTYELTEENAVRIVYSGVSDKTTVANMTNHSYFNLNGEGSGTAMDQYLTIHAQEYTPVREDSIPLGENASVEGTPMDFRQPAVLGERLNEETEQLKNGHGIDHNWVLDTKGNINEVCASLKSEQSGIKLEVYTDEPGIQIYTGNFLDGTQTGKKNTKYNFRASVCLETQKYPDTPNKPEWPSCVLRPGEKYTSHTIFKFVVE